MTSRFTVPVPGARGRFGLAGAEALRAAPAGLGPLTTRKVLPAEKLVVSSRTLERSVS